MNTQSFYDSLWDNKIEADKEDQLLFLRKESIDYSYASLGNLKDQQLLEIGCGSGLQTLYFLKQGAKVTAIDISQSSLDATRRLVETGGWSVKLTTAVMDAEKLELPEEHFDAVYINSVLMHVDPVNVISNAVKVLKKGGKLVVVEPLKYNPFIMFTRLFSPYRKTKPKYMDLKLMNSFKDKFTNCWHREFYFLAPVMIGPIYFSNNFMFRGIYSLLKRLDRGLQKNKGLSSLAWVTVYNYEK